MNAALGHLPIIRFDEKGRCDQVAKFRHPLEPSSAVVEFLSRFFRGWCVFRNRWYSFSRPLILDGLGSRQRGGNHPLDQPKLPRRSREILVSRIFELFYAAASTFPPWHLFLLSSFSHYSLLIRSEVVRSKM